MEIRAAFERLSPISIRRVSQVEIFRDLKAFPLRRSSNALRPFEGRFQGGAVKQISGGVEA